MKKPLYLLVVIPAYNEEKTIAAVIKEIPRVIAGIDKVEILVIDDGSTDSTVERAREAGADHIFLNKINQGLSFAFKRALDEALKLGADIIVNTDADWQYNQTEIPGLIEPILKNEAEMVIGNRQVAKLTHMTPGKKYGNMIGSFFIRLSSGAKVIDASSGFRAFSREAAMKFILFSRHTYTHETIIQAVDKEMRIAQISIEFKKRPAGQSRLITNFFRHIGKSSLTILNVMLSQKPIKVFFFIGGAIFFLGFSFGLRYLYFFFQGQSVGHIQSLILTSILISIGIIIIVMGFLAELIKVNRKIMEEILFRLRKQYYDSYDDRNKR